MKEFRSILYEIFEIDPTNACLYFIRQLNANELNGFDLISSHLSWCSGLRVDHQPDYQLSSKMPDFLSVWIFLCYWIFDDSVWSSWKFSCAACKWEIKILKLYPTRFHFLSYLQLFRSWFASVRKKKRSNTCYLVECLSVTICNG